MTQAPGKAILWRTLCGAGVATDQRRGHSAAWIQAELAIHQSCLLMAKRRLDYLATVNLRPAESVLRESEAFFARRGAVHTTLRRLVRNLESASIPYAIIGGMALNLFGYTRETTDVDILLTGAGLDAFRERLVGRGYVPAFPGALKSFRDAETQVKIEVITTGEFPGDGKPKPVAYPDPARASIDRDGYQVIGLEHLIELKLASGLSAAHRQLIDLADVQRLIEELHLPIELAEDLDATVQSEYRRLWELAQQARQGPHERE